MSAASTLVIICIILGVIIFCGLPVLIPWWWQERREREPVILQDEIYIQLDSREWITDKSKIVGEDKYLLEPPEEEEE